MTARIVVALALLFAIGGLAEGFRCISTDALERFERLMWIDGVSLPGGEDLRAILTGQFARMNEQFGQVNEQFTRIDRRFDALILELDRRFTGLDERISAFRAEMDDRFREVFGHFDGIYGRLERLEQEYCAISQQLRRIEAALTDEGGRREILERDLAVLKEHVGLIQARIAEIERRLGA
jgi:hypothetical protein